MAIADTITSMQTHTSNAYTMIGYGTDLTGINKNLENLSTSIFNAFLEALRTPDTLFTNLPKKSGSGSNITLNDTANAPMRIELSPSELTQDGTPTPSSPQDIHTISGSNTILVRGTQLFNKNDIVSGKWLNSNDGHESSDSNFGHSNYILIDSTNVYYLSGMASGSGNNPSTCFYDKNKTFISGTANNNRTEISINTIPANAKYMQISFKLADLNTIMLNIGSTALPYTPYVSQEADIDLDTLEYCKIGNYEDKFIRNSGKNKFDENLILNATGWSFTNNHYTGNISNLRSYFQTLTYDNVFEENTQYTFKWTGYLGTATNVRLAVTYTDNTTGALANIQTTTEGTFTGTSASGKTIKRIDFDYGNSGTLFITNIMLSKENIDYEPYGSNEWYIKKNIGKYVANNDITGNGQTDNYVGMLTPTLNVPLSLSSSTFKNLCLCNLMATELTGATNYSGLGGTTGTGQIRINLSKSYCSDYATADTFLTNNNFTIYYVMGTPTYTKITGTLAEQLEYIREKMLSQNGQTNISQVNNDLSFVINASALEDLS